MKMAEKFERPVIVLVDTPAAYPGIESEERGVAEAIAYNLREMAVLDVPIIVAICGEGGSGGALGLAIGDRVLIQEFAIYSVIPPEGCAAILWRDSARKVEASEALKLTAPDMLRLGIVDAIVPEPVGRRAQRPRVGRRPARPRDRRRARVRAPADVGAADRQPLREVPADGPARGRFRRPGIAGRGLMRGHTIPALGRAAVRRSGGGRLSASAGLGLVTARLLCQRGITTAEEAARFLHPSLDHLHDPFRLTGMDAAVDARAVGDRAPRADRASTATTTWTASRPR